MHRGIDIVIAGNEGQGLGRGQGRREIITLAIFAAQAVQPVGVLGIFHPLDHHGALEVMRQGDDGGEHQLAVGVAARRTGEKALVELHRVERQAAELAEAGGAGAEIVDRQAGAGGPEAGQHLGQFLVRADGAFRHFQFQGQWRNPAGRQHPRQQSLEVAVAQLAARKIDTDKQGGCHGTITLPMGQVAGRPFQRESCPSATISPLSSEWGTKSPGATSPFSG